ncbi:hypothetical protein C7M84_013572 [Penaeus vannamei]|uniref:Uncharacterized protein n=1 Tax=Penaeus vannamei TaxID=6689 RepID=A0A3R7M6C0_PENVA|nr:hypothetical protein C7M84_013572 [Penaeus vannamei]
MECLANQLIDLSADLRSGNLEPPPDVGLFLNRTQELQDGLGGSLSEARSALQEVASALEAKEAEVEAQEGEVESLQGGSPPEGADGGEGGDDSQPENPDQLPEPTEPVTETEATEPVTEPTAGSTGLFFESTEERQLLDEALNETSESTQALQELDEALEGGGRHRRRRDASENFTLPYCPEGENITGTVLTMIQTVVADGVSRCLTQFIRLLKDKIVAGDLIATTIEVPPFFAPETTTAEPLEGPTETPESSTTESVVVPVAYDPAEGQTDIKLLLNVTDDQTNTTAGVFVAINFTDALSHDFEGEGEVTVDVRAKMEGANGTEVVAGFFSIPVDGDPGAATPFPVAASGHVHAEVLSLTRDPVDNTVSFRFLVSIAHAGVTITFSMEVRLVLGDDLPSTATMSSVTVEDSA